ncbi:SDR family NAD(P)-dependent oxidoreductase [Pseudohongiella spirulinae]|uniref:Short-chain dehydrogenase/reductase SDR n=1 Tax=Pseudohongiella spirulinae TaxID=1249552 RepID=A0A0S2KCX5_9GAMM|nr:SDR family oxidoreductase [Pseudohongiella spirulinae]ALO45955.1 Short-chain dehydrogenase/reductase SDR [Pseudohongiella spirulinae]
MKNFNGKVIVITGAGSGMGRAYALEFARMGARLALCDIDTESLQETCKLVTSAANCDIYSQPLDVSDRNAVSAFADSVKQRLGNAHMIINNAGIGGGGQPAWHMEDAQYERTLQINFLGVVYGTRAFLPQLLANAEGAIVNVSSVFGLVGVPNTSDYCAAKFAVRGFTESLMVELSESPVTVHLVHPGGIRTNIAKGVEGGDEFTQRFLKTDANEFVRYVIKALRKGRQRIIYGHQSKPLWLMSWLLPLRLRNILLYRQMQPLLDSEAYKKVRSDDLSQ